MANDIADDLETGIAEIAGRIPMTQAPASTHAVTFPDLRKIEAHATAVAMYRQQLRGTLESMANEADALTKALDAALTQLL